MCTISPMVNCHKDYTGMKNIICKNFHLLKLEMLWQTGQMAIVKTHSIYMRMPTCGCLPHQNANSSKKKIELHSPHHNPTTGFYFENIKGEIAKYTQKKMVHTWEVATSWCNVLHTRFGPRNRNFQFIFNTHTNTPASAMSVHEQHIECDRMDFNLIPFE